MAARQPPGLRRHPDGRWRCWWTGTDPAYVTYHDDEWGHPCHDEVRLLEKLCLEGFQAGLSWSTILRKRPAFRVAFAGFRPEALAAFGPDDVVRLLADPGIVRHRGKIEAAVANARATLALAERGDSLTALVWRHAPRPRPRPNHPDEIPAVTDASTRLARELKAHGFRFVGPTTAYAFMQSMGLVDDHLAGCQAAPEPPPVGQAAAV